MTTISHAILGQIDLSSPGLWEGTVTLADRPVSIDLTLDQEDVPSELLASAFRLVDDLGGIDAVARAALLENLGEDDDAATKLYVSHHVRELSDADLRGIIGAVKREDIDEADFLARLRLVRVGLYPENAENHAAFDYSIGTEVTNYLLTVSFDSEGRVSGVEMES